MGLFTMGWLGGKADLGLLVNQFEGIVIVWNGHRIADGVLASQKIAKAGVCHRLESAIMHCVCESPPEKWSPICYLQKIQQC